MKNASESTIDHVEQGDPKNDIVTSVEQKSVGGFETEINDFNNVNNLVVL